MTLNHLARTLTLGLLMLLPHAVFAAESTSGTAQGTGILMLVLGSLAIVVVGFVAISRSAAPLPEAESEASESEESDA